MTRRWQTAPLRSWRTKAQRAVIGVFCLLVVAGSTTSSGSRPYPPVDLALVLAVDVSNSVNWFEYELQKFGISRSIRDADVVKAMRAGRLGRIAVTVVQWAGPGSRRIAVDWTVLSDQASADRLSKTLKFMPREFDGDATNISGAISFSTELLSALPFDATRKVIDVSGDGPENISEMPHLMRDRAVAAGITINGLAIENEEPRLRDHYLAVVVGGPGAFVLPVKRYEDFAEAMKKKLIREIDPKQLSWIPTRNTR